jgi:hypothetical protein
MLSRLFGTTDPNASPDVYRPGAAPASGRIYSFLTSSDRSLVSGLYDYAQANGVDPTAVDHFAFDLAAYRQHPNPPDMVGSFFDAETGQPQDFAFKDPEDEATAQRILTSKAMRDTTIPRDFLQAELDPGRMGVHVTDFKFLEQVVYASSASGTDGAHDPTAVLAPRPKERLAAMQAAGTLPPPEQMRMVNTSSSASSDLLATYAARIAKIAPSVTDSDRDMLSALYARAGQQDPSSSEMKRIDHLAGQLSLLRMATAISSNAAERARANAKAGADPAQHYPDSDDKSRRSRLDVQA